MAEEDLANVFAVPDFELSAKWLNLPSKTEDQFFKTSVVTDSKPRSRGETHRHQHDATVEGFFKIPDALAPLDSNIDENEEDHNQSLGHLEPLHDIELPDLDVLDGLWHDGANPPAANAEYRTWDAFLNPETPQSAPLFITEAGPRVYDAAMAEAEDPLKLGSANDLVVQSQPYVAALLALTLGRGSVFFVWDARKAVFAPAVEKMRISGYSTEVLQGLQDLCMKCGTTTRFLSSYVQLVYKKRPSPVGVALAKAIDILLLALQQQLGKRGGRARSLLRLQSLVAPVEAMLVYLGKLVANVSRMRSDEQIISHVSNETQDLGNKNSLLQALMCEVLSRVTEPWADFAQKWMGVKGEEGFPMTKDGPGKSFVKVKNIASVDDFGYETEERDYVFDESRMPDFVPPDVGLVMFETGRNLRLLRTHHPTHPLCDPGVVASCEPPDFRWSFDWKAIENLQVGVKRFEKAVWQKALPRSYDEAHNQAGISASGQGSTLQVFGNDGAHLEQRLLASMHELDQAPAMAVVEDRLAVLLEECLFHPDRQLQLNASGSSPHWSLIPLFSFGPLVTSQAKLVNREYMRLLFSDHHLREHLRVQKEFQLLGNGMFCSRLSHALFDPDLETAERKAGVALSGGVMGLRMNGRESWPPASSELRLALMGVLSETYICPSSSEKDPYKTPKADLPGDLSFSLRDLPPEEIDKCMDPSSLEALDFLRLAYKTPPPLSPVITAVVLVKYDRIFKLLLRVLRMLYVVGQLYRDTRTTERLGRDADDTWLRFKFEAQHFVQSIANYFFDTGIQTSWNQFERWLDEVELDISRVDNDSFEGTRVVSPDEVQEQHEKMLDHIMNVLLLRKRQQPVMALVEDIFRLILQFSRQVQLEVGGKVEGNATSFIIQELYGKFKKKVEVFVTVCRGLGEKTSARKRDTMSDGFQQEGFKEENSIERLLINLDMLGYYSRPKF